MRLRPLLLVWLALGTCLAGSRPSARTPSVVDLLACYASGDFQGVVADLWGDVDFNEILKQLRRDGPGWIDAAGPQHRERSQGRGDPGAPRVLWIVSTRVNQERDIEAPV